MNKKTTYEVAITEKVAQLPVPDMADSIWAKIAIGLDAASPGDVSNPEAPSEPLPAKTAMLTTKVWLAVITIVAIAALILIFIKNKRKERKAAPKQAPAAMQVEPQTRKDSVDTNTTTLPGATVSEPTLKPQQPVDSVSATRLTPLTNQPITNEPMPNKMGDSLLLSNKPVITGKPDSTTNIPPPIKKPRGVGGIQDSDYKITSGKKDSLKVN
ncbi:MAG: hypothetical protein EOO13_07615 [Chitinophagaceae bacterium]|nr:MAG: hypothetical protein EOO13_07615 [Chitinophagaceae bacterium]